MGSVNSNGGSVSIYLIPGFPNLGSIWGFGFWYRVNSYTTPGGIDNFGSFSFAAGIRVCTGNGTIGATSETILDWYQNGAADHFNVALSTGSSTAWRYVCAWREDVDEAVFHYGTRLENVGSLTTGTISASDAPVIFDMGAVDNDHDGIFGPGGSSHTNVDVRSYKAYDGATGATRWLAESADLNSLVNSTDAFFFADLDSTTNAGTDLSGAGNNHSVFGTLANTAAEPNAALPGGGGEATAQSGLAFTGGMGGGFRKPANDGGRWTRGRGERIWRRAA